MEIYDNLLNYSKETIKNEFIFEDTSIEELIYLKNIIEERINEIIGEVIKNEE